MISTWGVARLLDAVHAEHVEARAALHQAMVKTAAAAPPGDRFLNAKILDGRIWPRTHLGTKEIKELIEQLEPDVAAVVRPALRNHLKKGE